MRIIARLDIKGPNLIKGYQFEGLRIIGNPNEYAVKYYKDGADELLLIDTVASLYERNNLLDIINSASKDVFIPITVGGGIRTVEDAEKVFKNGADKIAINSAAVRRPSLINDLVRIFGSQAIVVSIQAKKIEENKWLVYLDGGRENTGLDVLKWLNEAVERGAGEILITSIDQDGTKKGFDFNLYKNVSGICKLPIIMSGGMGKLDDIKKLENFSKCDAIASATMLHYNLSNIKEIKKNSKNYFKNSI